MKRLDSIAASRHHVKCDHGAPVKCERDCNPYSSLCARTEELRASYICSQAHHCYFWLELRGSLSLVAACPCWPGACTECFLPRAQADKAVRVSCSSFCLIAYYTACPFTILYHTNPDSRRKVCRLHVCTYTICTHVLKFRLRIHIRCESRERSYQE